MIGERHDETNGVWGWFVDFNKTFEMAKLEVGVKGLNKKILDLFTSDSRNEM